MGKKGYWGRGRDEKDDNVIISNSPYPSLNCPALWTVKPSIQQLVQS